MKRIIRIITLVILICPTLKSQDLGNSPYSRFGIGDIQNPAFAHQAGMSNVGVSFASPVLTNNINPALLSKTYLTIFEAGVLGQFKELKNTTDTQQDFGASINYLSLTFPISRFWKANIGLKAFSSVSWDNRIVTEVPNTTVFTEQNYQGSGGTNTVYFASGFQVLPNLSLGFKLNYLFGTIREESVTNLNTGTASLTESVFQQQNSFSDLLIETGAAYSWEVKENTLLNIGLTYSLPSSVRRKSTNIQQNRVSTTGAILIADTTENNQDNVNFPAKYTIGASLQRPGRWVIALDFSTQDWSDFQNNEVLNSSNEFGMGYSLSIGGEYTPLAKSILSSYWSFMTYRAGLNYTQTSISIDGEQINDLSASFGLTLPFKQGTTLMHFAFIFGRRGKSTQVLLQENYVRCNLGVTINDRWFIKRKFD